LLPTVDKYFETISLSENCPNRGQVIVTHHREFRVVAASETLEPRIYQAFLSRVLPKGGERSAPNDQPEILIGHLLDNWFFVSLGWVLPDDVQDQMGRRGLVFFHGHLVFTTHINARLVSEITFVIDMLMQHYGKKDEVSDQRWALDRVVTIREKLLKSDSTKSNNQAFRIEQTHFNIPPLSSSLVLSLEIAFSTLESCLKHFHINGRQDTIQILPNCLKMSKQLPQLFASIAFVSTKLNHKRRDIAYYPMQPRDAILLETLQSKKFRKNETESGHLRHWLKRLKTIFSR